MNAGIVIGLYVATGVVLIGADGWECVSELRLPQYPSLARQARLTGKASVNLKIDQHGRPVEIVVEGVHRLLEKTVIDSVRLSLFKIGCEDKSVRFQFIFELEDPPKQADFWYVLFRPPNVFVLRAAKFPVSGQSTR